MNIHNHWSKFKAAVGRQLTRFGILFFTLYCSNAMAALEQFLPDDVEDKDAFTIVNWVSENAAVLSSTAVMIITMLGCAFAMLDELKDYRKTGDMKKLAGGIFLILLVAVMAGAMTFVAISMIDDRF